MQISANFIHVACNWRPHGYNLHATGCQSHADFACASSQLRAKPPVFASTVREQLFELKNEDAIKKSNNLRDTCACKAYPLTLCMA
jgi:hypothetical protein